MRISETRPTAVFAFPTQDPTGSDILKPFALKGQRSGHAFAQCLQRPLVSMNANNANGRGFFDFADGLVTKFVRDTPTFIAVNRIEDLTNMDGRVTTAAEHRKMLAWNEHQPR